MLIKRAAGLAGKPINHAQTKMLEACKKSLGDSAKMRACGFAFQSSQISEHAILGCRIAGPRPSDPRGDGRYGWPAGPTHAAGGLSQCVHPAGRHAAFDRTQN